MELNINNQEIDQKPVSVLEGNEYCISRILARESSVGQSSRIFYRASEGVPFKWEMQPGTPKNIPHQEDDDNVLPICPSPLMQSLGFHLPNVDQDHETKDSALKKSKIWSLRKMVKKGINSDIGKKLEAVIGRSSKKMQVESSRFGEYSSSFCSNSSSSSSSSSFSSNSRVNDTATIDGPFCCSPLNVPFVLDEGNKRIYYCSKHKTSFAVEDDGILSSRILSSTDDRFSGPSSSLHNEITHPAAGVPFRWEMQPGTPKTLPENDVTNIPPPSPPPALQSLALPLPRLRDGGGGKAEEYSTWGSKAACFTIRRKNKEKEKTGESGFDASFRESGSVSPFYSLTRSSKGDLRVSKIQRNFQGGCFSCGGHWRRKDILVFARRKLKSFVS